MDRIKLTRRAALALAPGALLAARGSAWAGSGRGGQRRALKDALQQAVDDHLEARRTAEGITCIAANVSLGDHGRDLNIFSGTVSKDSAKKVGPGTLFEIGSNTKSFTSALLLQLEAQGLCSIDQTVGDWLPQYPAWANVSIRRLLDMTSGLPTYSEAPLFQEAVAKDPYRHWTPEQLVAFAYPGQSHDLPPNSGYFYSNTNYILAGMIAAKAGGATYDYLLQTQLIGPLNLNDSYYSSWAVPKPALKRLASGYFLDTECGLYEPDCKTPTLAPLYGQDVRTFDLSWTGAAGGIVGNPRDLTKWVRALFSGRVLPPKQLARMMEMVSLKTGKPITDVSADDPQGFALGLGRLYQELLGAFWFYEGETLGYRVIFGWFADKDLVISIATNSHPPGPEDHIGALVQSIYGICTST